MMRGTARAAPVVDTTHAVTITVTDADDPGVITFSATPPSAGTEIIATLTDDDGLKAGVDVVWKWESSTDQNSWTVIYHWRGQLTPIRPTWKISAITCG